MVRYNPSAKKAFDYLWMNPMQKRGYLQQLGVSKREFLESFKTPKIYREELTVPEVMEMLGICSRTFAQLNEVGFFGEVRDNPETTRGRMPRLVSSDRVEGILNFLASMIPVSHFRELYKGEKYYYCKRSFNEEFIKYFEYPLGDNSPMVSLKNAARIIGKMRRRKAMFEEWHTLEDLSRDSGLNLSDFSLSRRYGRMVREGKLRLRRINGVDKLCPYEYARMLEIETRDAKELEKLVDTHYIARRLKIGDNACGAMIKIGSELGFLHPSDFSLRDEIDRYFIPRDEAESWIDGKLNIPASTKYSRLRKTLSIEQIRELLIKESEGVPIVDVASQIGVNPNTVAIMVAQGMKLGLLNPVSYKTHGSNRHAKFLLTKEDANKLVSGELAVPAKTRLASLRRGLSNQEIIKLIERESQGIPLAEIQEQTGYNINYLRTKLRAGERLGLLHPERGIRRMYTLPRDEAEKLVNGELAILSRGRAEGSRRELYNLETRRIIDRGGLRRVLSLAEIQEQTGYSLWRLRDIIRVGKRLGLFHPIKGDGIGKPYFLPEHEARRLINGDLIIPTTIRFETLKKELANQEIKKLIERESQGVTLDKIQAETGYNLGYLKTLVKIGEKMGLLHPVNHRYSNGEVAGHYILSQEEARKLINGDIKIPLAGFSRLEQLGISVDDREEIEAREQSALYKRLKQGDPESFSQLHSLYSSTLEHLKSKYRFRANSEDLPIFLQQSLYEALIQVDGNLNPQYIEVLIEEKLKQRVREERPSWISLDEEKPQKSGSTRLIDIIDENGKLDF